MKRRVLSSNRYEVVLGVLVILALLACALWGCVHAGYDSGKRTTTHPDGSVTQETWRRAKYTDSREAAMGAGNLMMGMGGLFEQLGTGGMLGGAGGIGAVGAGLLWLGRKLGYSKGHDAGWEERQRAGTVQQPLPEAKP